MPRKRARRIHTYSCEAELCEEFAVVARQQGFHVYAETGMFDLLLVVPEGVEIRGFRDGDQIGVQAKLFDDVEVLYQSLPRPMHQKQPDFYCALVPYQSEEFKALAGKLRITSITGGDLHDAKPFDFHRKIYWYRQTPSSRCWVPPCEVPDLKAGVNAPVQMTRWKADAIRLCMRGVQKGYLTKADFDEYKISITRWLAKQWVVGTDFIKVGTKRVKRYELIESNKPPHIRYGVVTDAMMKAGVL